MKVLKKTFWRWLACAMCVVCCLSPSTLLAQQGAGVLVGTVIDTSTKEPLVDVVVTATSPALQGEQTVVTDSSGLYRIPALPPGTYKLTLDKEKYKPYAREAILLRADTTLRVNAELLPEGIKADEVTVVARAPVVDVGSSSTGMNIGQDFARRIPLARPGAKGSASRSFESVAEAVPGAQEDRFGVSMSGTTSPENNYVVDGTSVNNPASGAAGSALSMEFIKELNVQTGGYMPEYGRATGGHLNVVTKSGSNEFHGSVFSSFSPGALEGPRKTVRKDLQSVVTTQQLAYLGDVGADIGGPIKKDKLWFYTGFDISRTRYNLGRELHRINRFNADGTVLRDASTGGLSSTEAIPGTYRSYVAESQQIQAMGKLTYLVNPDNTITLSVWASPMTSGGNGKYSIDPLTGLTEVDPFLGDGINGSASALAHKRIYNAYDGSLRWSSAWSNKRVLLDTTIGWHHQDAAVLPIDGSEPGSGTGLAGLPRITWARVGNPSRHPITDFTGPSLDPDGANTIPPGYCDPTSQGAPVTAFPCPVRLYNTGGPGFIERQKLDRYQARSNLTLLLQAAGHHTVKTGVDFEALTYDHLKAYSGGVYYREDPGGGWFDDFRGYGHLTGGDQHRFFDKLQKRTNSITIGGFVQDSWSVVDKITLNLGVRYDAQFLYNAAGERALSLPNQWSPRLGVIYDPTQAGRAKIFANYARFYEGVPLIIADRALSPEPGITSQHPAAPCSTAPGQTMGPCVDDPRRLRTDITQPDPNSLWKGSGAGAIAIDPQIKPQSSDELVLGAEYEILRDARLRATYTKRWLNNIIEDMSRDEATTFFLGNPGYGMASDFPKPVRNYDAVTVAFSKVFTDGWLGEASYLWSYLRGNYAGLFRAETNQLDPNISSDFDLKSLLPNRFGPLPGDRTHQIKLFGAKDWAITPQHHVTTGMAGRARSGEPTSTWGGHTLYGPDEVYILERGSGQRLPWNYSTDFQIAYRYNIDKDKSVQITFDIFNLFNFQGVTAVDQRYTGNGVVPVPGARQINPDGTITGLRNEDGTEFGTRLDRTNTCTPVRESTCPINPNYGNPTQYQPPRIFRFGLRGTF